MATVRATIEEFIYPHLEYFTKMVYEGGMDTEFMGIRVMDDDSRFTHGALVNGACILYAHYCEVGDPREDEARERLLKFIRIAASGACKTWGKLGILRGFNTLFDAGLLDNIPEELVELIKVKTEYDDFFDKENMKLRGMATNYLQVAMACAGFRERLGWENDGYAAKISEILLGILKNGAVDGWMDDELPHGRFDRYSLILTSEYADTMNAIGLPVPESVLCNLKRSAEEFLFAANRSGDGVIYGRSVACHGDATGAECISSALACGLIDEERIAEAIAYSHAVIKKITEFWYDSRRRSFNIWFDGRSTNYYRSIARVLEVNIDMAIHLFSTLANFKRAALADTEVGEVLRRPKKWEAREIKFVDYADNAKSLVMLRRGDVLINLPFVGHGKAWIKRASYYAFPAVHRLIEASPIAEYPFMIPEYTDKDGNIFRVCQYFDAVEVTSSEDGAKIRATGNLAKISCDIPEMSDYRFEITFEIENTSIKMRCKAYGELFVVSTVLGANDPRVKITAVGYEKSEKFHGVCDAIHSRLLWLERYEGKNTELVGYDIELPI